MAKKFGKFLLFTAAVGTAAAAIHYYLQKKKAENAESEDADYDDFSDEPKSYVPLTPETKSDTAGPKDDPEPGEKTDEEKKAEPAEGGFTPLKDTVEDVAGQAEAAVENVEEFFDEEDDSDQEPAIKED